MKFVITESQLKLITEGMSFEKVYKDTFPAVFKFVCMKFAKGNQELAKEYCQTGFIHVYNNLDKFRGKSSILTWVSRVVKNQILSQLRKKDLDVSNDVEFEKMNIAYEPEEKEEDVEYMGKYSPKDIKDAIEQLPDGYKFIFIRYYYNDKSHKEIAKELGISEGTSRSQLFKARNEVKKYLESLNRLEESSYLPNPEEKEYMKSIQKNEKYSNLLTKGFKDNQLVNEVEVVEFPPDKYNETPTYKITVFMDASKIKDIHLDVKHIYNELNFMLTKVLGKSLKLRDKIKFETE